MRLVILGAGGHAQVIADAILKAQETGSLWEPVGFLDDNPSLESQTRLGLPILGPLSALSQIAHEGCVIGIGENLVREQLFRRLEATGEHLVSIVHPHVTVASDVTIGNGTVVFAGVIVNTGTFIGNNVILNTACTVDHHNSIADHAHIAPGAHLGGDVSIGEGALIGIGATVMPQRTVGNWTVVGAGAVVNVDVQDGQTVIGVPAKPLITVPNVKNSS